MPTPESNAFSVLMSIYKNDQFEHVVLAVDSILNQTVKPNQVVIVFDGPVKTMVADYLNTLATTDSSVEIHPLETNRGLAKALNYGLDFCQHDIIARMDADDYALPNRFELMLPYFSAELALLGAVYDIYDENLEHKIGTRLLPLSHAEIVKYAKTRTPFNHPTIFFRKSAVQQVGGYPDAIGRFEDWGLALRLINGGFKLQNLDDTVLKFRGGEGMLARRSGWKYAKEELHALWSMYQQGLLPLTVLLRNVFLRLPIRLLPPGLVKKIYSVIQKSR